MAALWDIVPSSLPELDVSEVHNVSIIRVMIIGILLQDYAESHLRRLSSSNYLSTKRSQTNRHVKGMRNKNPI
jgi:hypothetical protein